LFRRERSALRREQRYDEMMKCSVLDQLGYGRYWLSERHGAPA
jgi:hypothetical protein